MFMVLSSWHSHCESSPGSFDECRLRAGWPPNLRPNQPIWAASPPKDWLLPSADTIASYYYYSARKLILRNVPIQLIKATVLAHIRNQLNILPVCSVSHKILDPPWTIHRAHKWNIVVLLQWLSTGRAIN